MVSYDYLIQWSYFNKHFQTENRCCQAEYYKEQNFIKNKNKVTVENGITKTALNL